MTLIYPSTPKCGSCNQYGQRCVLSAKHYPPRMHRDEYGNIFTEDHEDEDLLEDTGHPGHPSNYGEQ